MHCDGPEAGVRLGELSLDPDCSAVAILPALELDGFIRALRAGASGVVYVDTPSSITSDVFRAAAQNEVVMPRQAAQNLALLAQREKPPTDLTEAQAMLLRAVLAGRH